MPLGDCGMLPKLLHGLPIGAVLLKSAVPARVMPWVLNPNIAAKKFGITFFTVTCSCEGLRFSAWQAALTLVPSELYELPAAQIRIVTELMVTGS